MIEAEKSHSREWSIIHVKARVDFSNQAELLQDIRTRIGEGGAKIALDLRSNRFLSLPAIKGCVELAAQVRAHGGEFALTFCPERTKRLFEIYGSLDNIQVLRTAGAIHEAEPR